MDLDLIEAVDPKQAIPGCYLERCVYVTWGPGLLVVRVVDKHSLSTGASREAPVDN